MAATTATSRVCAACEAEGPTDRHHLVPRVLGGTDLPTVPLCRVCHGAVHGVAWTTNHSDLVKAGIAAAKARRLANPEGEPKVKKKLSQTDFLLEHLQGGNGITRLEAFHYGIANLTARIADLRSLGHMVRCDWRKDARGAEYGRFYLVRNSLEMAA